MPESLLRILNGCLLALLFLFFLRVMRAVWVQVNAPPLPPAPAPPAAARAASAPAPAGAQRPAAPPTATGDVKLRIIEPPEQRGQTYPLGDEVTVGRAAGCGVALADATVSQLHARVFRRDGRLYVEDLGSTNGTWVNRARVSAPVPLKRGDRLQVGSTVMEVAR
jgi:pSer/pThr/pTyr-binding forkhead associated (FHA) protein